MATPFRARLLAGKVRIVLQEWAGELGRCPLDYVGLVFAVQERWPRTARPKLYQVEMAIAWLVEHGQIKTRASRHGGRTVVLCEPDGEEVNAGEFEDEADEPEEAEDDRPV